MNVSNSLISNSQKLEENQVSFNEQMAKPWSIHAVEYYSAMKKKQTVQRTAESSRKLCGVEKAPKGCILHDPL